MARITNNVDSNGDKNPILISRSVFQALAPFEQIAARALEKCGSVKIVENIDVSFVG